MKKISKILSIVLVILMVVCALPISVSAQNVTLTIESSKNDIKAGDIVTVNVILSENSNLSYFTLNIVYDNSKLEYVPANSSENGDEEESDPNPLVINSAYAANKIRVATASTNPITAGGTILSVDFKALSSSCSTVSLDVIESGDKDLKNIPISTSPIKIHSFGDWTTVREPTCEDTGKNKKTCTCGEEITETVGALGHDYAIEFTVDSTPSCTNEGSKSQHCSRCDSKQNVTPIPATEHDYQMEITKVPSHTENGEKTFTCNNCRDSYTETIKADGTHKHISSITDEPTCTEKGVMTYTCACGDSYTEEISANGHTEVVLPAVAPTCTETGLTAGVKCSVCDDVITAQTVVPAKGHTEVVLPAVAPTCTETGLTEGTKCSACGETLDAQDEIPATGHSVADNGYCETCEEKVCDHNCHKGGISGFFWKITNFFNKLFGSKKYCECGIAHY